MLKLWTNASWQFVWYSADVPLFPSKIEAIPLQLSEFDVVPWDALVQFWKHSDKALHFCVSFSQQLAFPLVVKDVPQSIQPFPTDGRSSCF